MDTSVGRTKPGQAAKEEKPEDNFHLPSLLVFGARTLYNGRVPGYRVSKNNEETQNGIDR